MTSMVESIQTKDIPDIAAYFASRNRKANMKTKTPEETGKRIYLAGIKVKGVPACASYHGFDARGKTDLKFPSLARQHKSYLVKMLKEFRSKKRHNDPQRMMQNVAAELSDKEISALSNYIAGMY